MIYISLMINDVGWASFHVLNYYLHIFFGEMSIFNWIIRFLKIYPVVSVLTISFYYYYYYWVVRVLYISWIQVPYQMNDLQIFSPILWIVFSLFWWYHLQHRNFKILTYFNLSNFLLSLVLLVLYVRPNPRSWIFTPCFLLKVL